MSIENRKDFIEYKSTVNLFEEHIFAARVYHSYWLLSTFMSLMIAFYCLRKLAKCVSKSTKPYMPEPSFTLWTSGALIFAAIGALGIMQNLEPTTKVWLAPLSYIMDRNP